MGFVIRPGHPSNGGLDAWQEVSHTDVVQQISVGELGLGNWGSSFGTGTDSHSPLYSIPNPWASAYLYQHVLNDNTHPLAEPLLLLLLDLMIGICRHSQFEIVSLQEPPGTNSFYKFWSMAPSFLRWDGRLYFIRDTATKKVVGGISKSSLMWVSQCYQQKRKRDELLQERGVCEILTGAKNGGFPDKTFFNNFWAHGLLNQILSRPAAGPVGEVIPNTPAQWIRLIPNNEVPNSKYYHNDINMLVFDEHSIKSDQQLLGTPNPPGFADQLKSLGTGASLPMNMGVTRWAILENLFERTWIRCSSHSENKTDQEFYTPNGGKYLWPVRPEFIRNRLRLEDLRIGQSGEAAGRLRMEFEWRNLRSAVNEPIVPDGRTIGIWPPHASDHTPNYIVEYTVPGTAPELQGELEFYDDKGDKIDSVQRKYPQIGYNSYKLSRKGVFPRYLRLLTNDGRSGGLLSVKPRPKRQIDEKIIAGVDFGTSHTTVAWKVGAKKAELVDFKGSSPIFLADSESRSAAQAFLPPPFGAKPNTKSEDYSSFPWQPFRTIWWDFAEQNEDDEVIQDGSIPFSLPPDQAGSASLKENLKWGEDHSVGKYRTLFLRQLLLMIMVEAEGVGTNDLTIRWSYPKAFSSRQLNELQYFWKNVLASYQGEHP